MSIVVKQSHGEEIANAISHGVGTLLGIAALVLMIVFSSKYGSPWHVVTFSIFGAGLIMLYLFSTLTHSFENIIDSDVFLVLDQAGIYFLIAATYTPFCLIPLHGPLGWTIFGIEWGLAVVGIVIKSIDPQRFIRNDVIITTVTYAVMGWLILIAIKPLYAAIGFEGTAWLIAGGLCYTGGILFFTRKNMKFHHLIWHIFIILGSVCHYFSVMKSVLPIEM